jgi:hypothetical protein
MGAHGDTRADDTVNVSIFSMYRNPPSMNMKCSYVRSVGFTDTIDFRVLMELGLMVDQVSRHTDVGFGFAEGFEGPGVWYQRQVAAPDSPFHTCTSCSREIAQDMSHELSRMSRGGSHMS